MTPTAFKWLPTLVVIITAAIAVGVMKADVAQANDRASRLESKHEVAMEAISDLKQGAARKDEQVEALREDSRAIKSEVKDISRKLDRLLERR